MSASFHVRVERLGEAVVVRMEGELDIAAETRATEAIEQAVGLRSPSVVVDLGAVTFIDSSGLRILVSAAQTAKASRSRLVLARPSQPVRRLLDLAGLEDRLDVVEDAPGLV